MSRWPPPGHAHSGDICSCNKGPGRSPPRYRSGESSRTHGQQRKQQTQDAAFRGEEGEERGLVSAFAHTCRKELCEEELKAHTNGQRGAAGGGTAEGLSWLHVLPHSFVFGVTIFYILTF